MAGQRDTPKEIIYSSGNEEEKEEDLGLLARQGLELSAQAQVGVKYERRGRQLQSPRKPSTADLGGDSGADSYSIMSVAR